MPIDVIAAVLLAALVHAGWNAIAKSTGATDPMISTSAIAIGGGIVALPLLLVSGLPATTSYPYVFASGVIHVLYFVLVGLAYRAAEYSAVYPITRGSAPLATSLLAAALLGEAMAPLAWCGVVLLSSGILGLGSDPFAVRCTERARDFDRGAQRGRHRRLHTHRWRGCASLTEPGRIRDRYDGDHRRAAIARRDGLARAWLGTRFIGAMAHRLVRRRDGVPVLRHRALGNDEGADRYGRSVARDVGFIRDDHRGMRVAREIRTSTMDLDGLDPGGARRDTDGVVWIASRRCHRPGGADTAATGTAALQMSGACGSADFLDAS